MVLEPPNDKNGSSMVVVVVVMVVVFIEHFLCQGTILNSLHICNAFNATVL